jgi:hypothetical protein
MSVFCIIPSPYLTIPSLVAVGYVRHFSVSCSSIRPSICPSIHPSIHPSIIIIFQAIRNRYEFPKKKKYAELSFCLSLSAFMCGLLTLVFVFVIATSIVGYIESENFKK